MRDNRFAAVDESVKFQFFQNALLHSFVTVLFRNDRILYPVIKNPRRNDLLSRMSPRFHLDSRIQVDRKLHLKPMIQCRDVKTFHPGLIIRYFYIHTAPVLAGIDPVDLPAPKLQLISAWHKISLFELTGKRPNRTADQPLDPPDHIFIPCRAEKYRIPVVDDTLFHTL